MYVALITEQSQTPIQPGTVDCATPVHTISISIGLFSVLQSAHKLLPTHGGHELSVRLDEKESKVMPPELVAPVPTPTYWLPEAGAVNSPCANLAVPPESTVDAEAADWSLVTHNVTVADVGNVPVKLESVVPFCMSLI
jgi:hypothetical protein